MLRQRVFYITNKQQHITTGHIYDPCFYDKLGITVSLIKEDMRNVYIETENPVQFIT